MATADTLQSLDAYEFEHYVAELWEAQGWETEVSQASGDAGIDVIARRRDPVAETHVIQAKRYQESNKVGGPEIQQYASLRQQVPGADAVVVVTTSSFTKAARERAEELNVKLVDGATLQSLAARYGAESPGSEVDVEPRSSGGTTKLGGGGGVNDITDLAADALYVAVALYVGLKAFDIMVYNIPVI